MGSMVGDQHHKHIRSARWTVLVVGILLAAIIGFLYRNLANEVTGWWLPGPQRRGPEAVNQANMIFFANWAVAGIYLVLFFVIPKIPFGGTLTALSFCTSVRFWLGRQWTHLRSPKVFW